MFSPSFQVPNITKDVCDDVKMDFDALKVILLQGLQRSHPLDVVPVFVMLQPVTIPTSYYM